MTTLALDALRARDEGHAVTVLAAAAIGRSMK